jgi:hypothetical protein
MLATPHDPDPSVQFMLPVGMEENNRKRPGGLLLSVILLAVIGYAGYRVYPPILDLWHLAHAPVETPAAPTKAEPTAPQTSNLENSIPVPPTPSTDTPQAAAAAAAPAPAPAVAENPAPQPAPQALPASTTKPVESPLATVSSTDQSSAPQKPAVPAPPSPARLLESRLRKELAGQPLADKVKIQATLTALTLSGSLSIAEHRDLLGHLRTVPNGVRVIDDTEYSEDQKATPTASASSGWVWVRSSPPGAQIIVDGRDTGQRTPVSLELPAGQHLVRLVLQGFGNAQREVLVNRGQTMQFTEALPAE